MFVVSGVSLEYHTGNNYEYFTVRDIVREEDKSTVEFETRMFKKLFLPPEETGSAKSGGVLSKQNSAVFLSKVLSPEHRHASCIMSASTEAMVALIDYSSNNFKRTHSAFGGLGDEISYGMLLSGYKNGDYYAPHRDRAGVTFIWWLNEPFTEYSGGSLILPDIGVEILPESYTGVVIPSWYRHEVSPIVSEAEGHVRYAVSCFMSEAE